MSHVNLLTLRCFSCNFECMYNSRFLLFISFFYRRQIENPTISFYTKSRETLKLYNESYYRKVKGQNYLKQVTISNEAVQDNTLIKSRVGTLNYIVNGKVNYSIDNKRINSSLPIIDLFPTDREYIIFLVSIIRGGI